MWVFFMGVWALKEGGVMFGCFMGFCWVFYGVLLGVLWGFVGFVVLGKTAFWQKHTSTSGWE